jgi:hypothetical protein
MQLMGWVFSSAPMPPVASPYNQFHPIPRNSPIHIGADGNLEAIRGQCQNPKPISTSLVSAKSSEANLAMADGVPKTEPMSTTVISNTLKFRQAARELENHWAGSADRLFEAKLKLLQLFIPKHTAQCPQCGTRGVYNQEFDANFCPSCNHWLEKRCGNQDCSYCAKRPASPLPTTPQQKKQMVQSAKSQKDTQRAAAD